MKRLENIVTAVTLLVLLTFCGGGIGLVKCACSGKVSFLLPDRHGCCPTEGGCMTVTTLQVSDSNLSDGVDMPRTMPVALPAFEFPERSCKDIRSAAVATCPADMAPPGITHSMVRRV